METCSRDLFSNFFWLPLRSNEFMKIFLMLSELLKNRIQPFFFFKKFWCIFSRGWNKITYGIPFLFNLHSSISDFLFCFTAALFLPLSSSRLNINYVLVLHFFFLLAYPVLSISYPISSSLFILRITLIALLSLLSLYLSLSTSLLFLSSYVFLASLFIQYVQ